jgi:hypothetical protein
MILANPNPASAFLYMFDSCIATGNEDFCIDQVISAAPLLVKAYLKTYTTCLRVTSPSTCKTLLAPKTSPAPLIFLGIGGLIGYLIGKRK